MKYKLSVIIPFYNERLYLRKCIESVLAQTLEDVEIICVNDGSTDDSLDILKDYKGKVKVISKPNGGQSSARNAGLDAAQGEYAGFLDADDWAEPSMFEKLYKNAKENDADITMCSVCVCNEKTGEKTFDDPYFSLSVLKDAPKVFNYKDVREEIFKICVVPWNKIYKQTLLKDIRFVEGLIFEDNLFFLETFFKAQKCTLVNEPLVNFRRFSQTSCTTSVNEANKLDIFKIYEYMEKLLKNLELYDEFSESFERERKYRLKYWFNKLTCEKTKNLYLLSYLSFLRKQKAESLRKVPKNNNTLS